MATRRSDTQAIVDSGRPTMSQAMEPPLDIDRWGRAKPCPSPDASSGTLRKATEWAKQ